MLDPRWLKILRDAWQHKARSILVILAIALGLTGAGAILNTWALLQRATAEGYLSSLPVSATLSVEELSPAMLETVRRMPEIAAVRLRRSVQLAVLSGGRWRNALIFALDDFRNPGIGLLQAEAGAWPPSAGELVLEQSSLEFSGASLGETLQLRLGQAEPVTLPVRGLVRDVSLAPGWMENIVYAYVSPATLGSLGVPVGLNELQLRVRDASLDRAAVRRIAALVQQSLEAAGARVSRVEVPEPGEHIHAAQMDSLLLTQGAFGLLTLLVCAFLVVNLVNAMLAGQAREIGVMKTLGARPGQLARMYLGLALLLGLLASVLAVPAAILLARPYAALKGEMLNFEVVTVAIPAWAIALQLLVGCALPVLAAAWPVWRASRASVGAALRDIGISAVASGRSQQRGWLTRGFARPLLLAIGNAFRRRQRTFLTLLTLATGGAVYLGAANLRESVRGSVDLLFSAQRFDFSLRLGEPRPVSQIEASAQKVPGVAHAEAWVGAAAMLDEDDGLSAERFSLTGVPPDSRLLRPLLAAGRWLEPGDGRAVVVSRRLQRDQPAFQLGASLRLLVEGQSLVWTVVGVIDSGPQPVVYVPRQSLIGLRGHDRGGSLVLQLKPLGEASQLEVIRQLRSDFAAQDMPIASSQRPSESRRVLEDHLLMVVEFLGAMGWVMIAVGGMGLASTMSLGVLERTREIGVMRALGARHFALVSMIQIEGLVIAGLGWLLALPLSIPIGGLLAQAFGRVMFAVPIHWWPNSAASLRWLLLTVIVSLLACAWPARRATRVPTVAALAYE